METVPIGVLLLIQVALIAVNAFFACAELAVISVNEAKIAKLAEKGNKGAKVLKKVSEDSARFLSTIQVAITLAGFLGSAFAADNFSGMLTDWLISLGVNINFAVLDTLAVILITIILSYFTLVLGELVPKRLAMRNPEKIALAMAGVINGVAIVFKPIVFLLTKSTNAILRLLSIDPNESDEEVTEEEILLLVDEGKERGVIEEVESEMIENILDFNDTTVDEMMTHRKDVDAVSDESAIVDVVRVAVENGRSRLPVYHEDIDTIIGVCYIKDLLPYVGRAVPKSVKITDLIRPAYFVPETKKCNMLFSEMTERKIQIAVILDEYGGTAGVITIEDLMESIFGNMQDEYDNEAEEITKVSETEFTVDGTTPIDEISDLTGVELPEGDYDTIAGFVTEQLGYIPKAGEYPEITIDGLTITVLEAEERRVSKLHIVKMFPQPDEG